MTQCKQSRGTLEDAAALDFLHYVVLEFVLHTETSNTLIHILKNLETFLNVEAKMVIDGVFSSNANVGTKSVYAITYLGSNPCI